MKECLQIDWSRTGPARAMIGPPLWLRPVCTDTYIHSYCVCGMSYRHLYLFMQLFHSVVLNKSISLVVNDMIWNTLLVPCCIAQCHLVDKRLCWFFLSLSCTTLACLLLTAESRQENHTEILSAHNPFGFLDMKFGNNLIR